MNERFRHCISMFKMLNSENLLTECGLDEDAYGADSADSILYEHALGQARQAAMDEAFGNPDYGFQLEVMTSSKFQYESQFRSFSSSVCSEMSN